MVRRSSSPSGRQEGNQKDDTCGCGKGYNQGNQTGNKNPAKQNPNRDTFPQGRRSEEEISFEETDFLGSQYNQDQHRGQRGSTQRGFKEEENTEESNARNEREGRMGTTAGRDYGEGNTHFQAESNKPRRGRPRKQDTENTKKQGSSETSGNETQRRRNDQPGRSNQDF